MPHVVDPEVRPLHAEIYMALREYWLLTGQGPSKDELMRACLCSMPSIYLAEKSLVKKGYIVNPKFAVRAMKPVDFEVTLSHAPLDPWDTLVETKYWKAEAA